MNICAKSCKHYEYCIPLRYNNCRQSYMTEVEVIEEIKHQEDTDHEADVVVGQHQHRERHTV